MLNIKKRSIYFLIFVLLIVIEVYIATSVHDDFIRPYVGDLLVVVAVYCFVRIFIPTGVSMLPLYIFLFATVVELLQLVNFKNWLGVENPILDIMLGSTFDWKDIGCYAIGCFALAAINFIKSK